MATPNTPTTLPRALFPLGRAVATPGVLALIQNQPAALFPFIDRHQSGDWGDVDAEDAQSNADALKHGDRLLSAYAIHGTKIWIITEHDRSATTVLLPSEY